jgi:hypothetical protein
MGISLNSFINFIYGKSFLFNFLFYRDFFSLKFINFSFFSFCSLNFFFGSSLVYRRDFLFYLDSMFFFKNKFNKFIYLDSVFSFNIVSDYLGFITTNECGLVSCVNSSVFFKSKFCDSLIYLLSTDI